MSLPDNGELLRDRANGTQKGLALGKRDHGSWNHGRIPSNDLTSVSRGGLSMGSTTRLSISCSNELEARTKAQSVKVCGAHDAIVGKGIGLTAAFA